VTEKKAGNQRNQIWYKSREYTPVKIALAKRALEDILHGKDVFEAIRKHPLPGGEGYLGKHVLVAAYRQMVAEGTWKENPSLLASIRMKPMRTLSGVTTVTVLTKPYPCPGQCIFCPTDERMPKSYLPDEPGAMRAYHHHFDPYEQVKARIAALQAIGHPTDKIELLVLGGTWNAYPASYRKWFIHRCLDAMNGQETQTLQEAQAFNETAKHRNVGLVIETRPDQINKREIIGMRQLGVTKVQMGVQSLDDRILALNKRGHTVADTRRAVALLRAAGFKIVLHWMPNLLGATPDSDREDFLRLWQGINPDEIKIYPTQLLEGTELYQSWQRGEYKPYTTEQLIRLIADVKSTIPRYCRVNRIIRDIPSEHVVEGNKRTSLRQDAQRELARRGQHCQCIRCREVRGQKVDYAHLVLNDTVTKTDFAEEHFLAFDTPEDKLTGFLRLSLPISGAPQTGIADLENAAIIREIHVYGQSLQVGEAQQGAAQHAGLGTQLMETAREIARSKGYRRLAVISAIGTRQYYLRRGFRRGDYYLIQDL